MTARDAVREAEAAANAATERAAQLTATGQALTQAFTHAEARAKRVSGQLAQLRAEHGRAAVAAIDPARVAEAAALATTAEAAATAARQAQDAAERARATAAEQAAVARQRDAAAGAALAKLSAETNALAEILSVKDGERWPPMVDALTVPPGLEAALGAVLGEELSAAADPQAARHWRALPPLAAAALPAPPLADLVSGPAALGRALAGIGLVETDAEGDARQPALSAGQTLVSRTGAVWRWDGYTVRSGTRTAATIRLQQRNRLNGLRTQLADAKSTATAAAEARQAADRADEEAAAADAAARLARRDAEARWERARTESTAIGARAGAAAAKLAALDEQLARLTPEAADAEAALAAVADERRALPDLTMLRQTVERSRAALAAARAREAAAETTRRDLVRDAAARAARLQAIGAEAANWAMRATDAASRVADLRARAEEAAAEQAQLQGGPAAIATQAAEATEALQDAETAHAEPPPRWTPPSLVKRKPAPPPAPRRPHWPPRGRTWCVPRPSPPRPTHAWGTVAERILEKLGASPSLPPPPADTSPEAEERARRRLDRLTREREDMGPVNMRAAGEATEMEGRIAGIAGEKAELDTAIAKLRGSIGHINREGRERLTQVFTQVDAHFQQLFARMFGGGRGAPGAGGLGRPVAGRARDLRPAAGQEAGPRSPCCPAGSRL